MFVLSIPQSGSCRSATGNIYVPSNSPDSAG
jgi:hypothetical protein